MIPVAKLAMAQHGNDHIVITRKVLDSAMIHLGIDFVRCIGAFDRRSQGRNSGRGLRRAVDRRGCTWFVLVVVVYSWLKRRILRVVGDNVGLDNSSTSTEQAKTREKCQCAVLR